MYDYRTERALEEDMKKIVISLGLMGLSFLASGSTYFAAQEDAVVVNENYSAAERSSIVTAWGTTEGDIVSYRQDAPNTGQVAVHFEANNIGLVNNDLAVYTLMLPSEMREVASQSNFGSKIEGTVRSSTLTGERKVSLTSSMIEVYSDRIYISVPSGFWIGSGSVHIDLKMKYGEILKENPALKIKDNASGYVFRSGLRFTNGVLADIKKPLTSSEGSVWTSEEKSMMVSKSETIVNIATYKKGEKIIRGAYEEGDAEIGNSRVFMNGKELITDHDDSSFFKNKIMLYVGTQLSSMDEEDRVVIKCYDKNDRLLDTRQVELV